MKRYTMMTFVLLVISSMVMAKDTNILVIADDTAKTTYKRENFGRWLDVDNDCQDTRSEYLINTSSTQVTFKSSKSCTVKTGTWIDYYSGLKINDASIIDIDHVVPLKEAWISGAAYFNRQGRLIFANDFDNLVISHKSINRSKGSRDLSEWMPKNIKSHNKYIKKWIMIKNKYGLSANTKEMNYINSVKTQSKINTESGGTLQYVFDFFRWFGNILSACNL